VNPSRKDTTLPFIAYDVALEALRLLRPLVAKIRLHDAALAGQILEAGTSAPMNLAEGRKRRGRDARYHYSVASGSAAEARSGLDVAEALGYLAEGEGAAAWATLDRVCAMTWPLIR
jgi:four helix bundle protein